MFVQVDENGRIGATTDSSEYAGTDMFLFDFPEDFDFDKQDDYRIVDGELIYDPRPIPIEYQISELKQKLAKTDYVVTKIAEAQVTGVEMIAEDSERYAEVILERQQWRAQINELEAQLETEEEKGV